MSGGWPLIFKYITVHTILRLVRSSRCLSLLDPAIRGVPTIITNYTDFQHSVELNKQAPSRLSSSRILFYYLHPPRCIKYRSTAVPQTTSGTRSGKKYGIAKRYLDMEGGL